MKIVKAKLLTYFLDLEFFSSIFFLSWDLEQDFEISFLVYEATLLHPEASIPSEVRKILRKFAIPAIS